MKIINEKEFEQLNLAAGSKKNKHGAKARQRNDYKINRVWEYSSFNYENAKPNGYYCNDVDFIYYIFFENQVVPFAIIEATKAEYEIDPGYRAAVIKRYSEQGQGKFITTIGRMIGCPVYIVLWHDFNDLHIYSFKHEKWKIFNQESWLVYLDELKKNALNLKKKER